MRKQLLLQDELLYLRPLKKSDLKLKYLNWLKDPEINKYLDIRFHPPQKLNDLKNNIKDQLKAKEVFLFGIFEKKTKTHIGNIKLGPINSNHLNASIGFMIGDKTFWGRGFASRAIRIVLNFAFTELGLAKITAGSDEHNIGSQKALTKAGFQLEGRQRLQLKTSFGRSDGLLFGSLNPNLK
jgi:ribosomal-protein-alanine N-acetyltransferase